MTNPDLIQVIKNAANLLTDKTWIKGRLAIDNDGYNCNIFSKKACRWCAEGVILKSAYDFSGGSYALGIDAVVHIENYLEKIGKEVSLNTFNDRIAQNHEEVKILLMDSVKEEPENGCE